MTIWASSSLEHLPRLVLNSWSVRELENGDRHFVGWNATEGEGRVSSKIVEFDQDQLVGTTRSGRLYQLVRGGAGFNGDAEYVWRRWCNINSVLPEDYKDVSHEYDPMMDAPGDA